jgi:hypothetical protein
MSEAYPSDFPEEELKYGDTHMGFDYVLRKIKSIQKEVLVVFDNAEDLISNDKASFRKFLQKFLHIDKIKVLLTTTVNLKSTKAPHEEIIVCDELTTEKSWKLFETLAKTIPVAEVKELVKMKPDFKKFPNERH